MKKEFEQKLADLREKLLSERFLTETDKSAVIKQKLAMAAKYITDAETHIHKAAEKNHIEAKRLKQAMLELQATLRTKPQTKSPASPKPPCEYKCGAGQDDYTAATTQMGSYLNCLWVAAALGDQPSTQTLQALWLLGALDGSTKPAPQNPAYDPFSIGTELLARYSLGTPQHATGLFILETEAKSGDTKSQLLLSQYFRQQKNPKALNYYGQLAAKNIPAGYYNLGLCYEIGLFVTPDLKRAKYYYEKTLEFCAADHPAYYPSHAFLHDYYGDSTKSGEDFSAEKSHAHLELAIATAQGPASYLLTGRITAQSNSTLVNIFNLFGGSSSVTTSGISLMSPASSSFTQQQ